MRKAFFIILMAVIMAVCFTAPVMGGTTPAYSEPFHTWRTAVTIDQDGQEVSQSATIDGWEDLITMINAFDNFEIGAGDVKASNTWGLGSPDPGGKPSVI